MMNQQLNFIKVQFIKTLTCKCAGKSFIFRKEKYINKEGYLEEQLKEYPIEVINSISKTIEILDYNYGENRNIDNDLCGYILIAENIVDIEILKQYKIQGVNTRIY